MHANQLLSPIDNPFSARDVNNFLGISNWLNLEIYRDTHHRSVYFSAFSVISTRKQILQNIQVGGELTDWPKPQEILK